MLSIFLFFLKKFEYPDPSPPVVHHLSTLFQMYKRRAPRGLHRIKPICIDMIMCWSKHNKFIQSNNSRNAFVMEY